MKNEIMKEWIMRKTNDVWGEEALKNKHIFWTNGNVIELPLINITTSYFSVYIILMPIKTKKKKEKKNW